MIASPFSASRFRWIFIISIFVIAFVQVKALLWLSVSWQLAVTDTLISCACLVVALFAIINSLRFYVPSANRNIYLIFWCAVLAGIWTAVSWFLIKVIITDETHVNLVKISLPVRFIIVFLLLGIMTIFSVLWNELQKEKEIEERKTEAENLARNAELFKLRQQLQPHFLFNSLNSINALITTRPEEAKEMVQKLSEFLRGTLKKDEQQWVKLEEELHYLQLYLEIEKVRFGHRLHTEITCEDDIKKLELPSMLLQPLVENAIKFGLYDTTEDVTIQIRAGQEQENLVIGIENPFDPETSPSGKGTGFGLNSVQRRLTLLFGRGDLLQTTTRENIFITSVKIPQRS